MSLDTRNPRPCFSVKLGDKDLTGGVKARLVALEISAERDQDADQLDITLSDHDGGLALPSAHTALTVSLGWDNAKLVSMGTFSVDEIEHSGAPDKLVLRARSADMRSSIRDKRTQSWDHTTLGALVEEIAGRNGLSPHCAPSLASQAIAHEDQTNESDLNLITRLGQHFDAVATCKAGRLILSPVGNGKTAGGAAIPQATLQRDAGDQHRYHAAQRGASSGVRAYYHDIKAAKKRAVVVGADKTLTTLRGVYASQSNALRAARAEWNRIQRNKACFELNLARGRADLYPNMSLTVSGWKAPIDGAWLIKSVSHSLSDGGFTTRLACEAPNAPAPPSRED